MAASSSSSSTNGDSNNVEWDPEKMLRVYMHDYLMRKGMRDTAEIFKNEAQLGDTDVSIHSSKGFLHEWWSVFYEAYASRVAETGPEYSSEVPKMTDINARNYNTPPMIPQMPDINARNYNTPSMIPQMTDMGRNYNTPPMIPQIYPMSEQRPQQFQLSSSFNQITAQPPAPPLIPPPLLRFRVEDVEPTMLDLYIANEMKILARHRSNHPPQDVGKQDRKQRKDRGSIRAGNGVPIFPLEVIERTMQPLDGPHETKTNEALNIPLNGWPVNVGDGNLVLCSLLKEPNYRQQCQVLKTQNQESVPAQLLACTPKSQTLTVPGNSTICSSQYLKIPKTGSSNNDRQDSKVLNMMDQIIRTVEHQNQQDQQLQMQSLDVEKSGKRNKTVSLRPGESALERVGAADGKPVDENVVSFLSFENEHADHRNVPFSNLKRISTTYSRNENKGFSFKEVGCLHSSKSKVLSTHFSSDGKILASAGHEKKIFIWDMETFDCVTTEEDHSLLITDVRFRPGSTIFATSSFDRSIRLWDAARPTTSLFKLSGHDEPVMSLDFHPRKLNLLCSCDSNDVIRLWNVNKFTCMRTTKGGSKQVRFQPRLGKFYATAAGNNINLVDAETGIILCHLKGHVKDVLCICWDRNGDYIASVSEDSARVWSAVTDRKCINELQHSNGNKFQSCIFHPAYLNLLVVGGYQSLELWSPTEGNKTWAVPAHKGLIAGLAESPEEEMIASASHDHCVKVWK